MEKYDLEYLEDICMEAAEISQMIDNQKEEYNAIGNYISDIQKIENMNSERKNDLCELARMSKILEDDRKTYKSGSEIISDIDYQNFEEKEKNLAQIIRDMADNEKQYSMVKRDLKKLEGEKRALHMERNHFSEKLRLFRRMIKVIISALIILFVIYFFCMINYDIDMNMYFLITSFFAVALIMLFVVLYKKSFLNVKMIDAKTNKAIGLQNRIKLKYVNVYSGLDFMYEKYEVNSASELNKKVGRYSAAKRNKETYKTASGKLYEVNQRIIYLLEEERLYDSAIWLTQISAIYQPEELEKIRASLYSQRQSLRKKLEKNITSIDGIKETIKRIINTNNENAREILEVVERYEEKFI